MIFFFGMYTLSTVLELGLKDPLERRNLFFHNGGIRLAQTAWNRCLRLGYSGL
jgi:hypothetical protein